MLISLCNNNWAVCIWPPPPYEYCVVNCGHRSLYTNSLVSLITRVALADWGNVGETLADRIPAYLPHSFSVSVKRWYFFLTIYLANIVLFVMPSLGTINRLQRCNRRLADDLRSMSDCISILYISAWKLKAMHTYFCYSQSCRLSCVHQMNCSSIEWDLVQLSVLCFELRYTETRLVKCVHQFNNFPPVHEHSRYFLQPTLI